MKLKQIIISSFVILLLPLKNSKAQSFQQDLHYISVGYGFGNLGNSTLWKVGRLPIVTEFSYSTAGPIFLKYEYGISSRFGVGINVAYLSGQGSFNYFDGTTDNNIVDFSREGYNLNLRFLWHFGQHETIDTYLAIGGGYRGGSFGVTDSGSGYKFDAGILSNVFPIGGEIAFGSRFMFADNIGAFFEIGVCRAAFQVGLTGRF